MENGRTADSISNASSIHHQSISSQEHEVPMFNDPWRHGPTKDTRIDTNALSPGHNRFSQPRPNSSSRTEPTGQSISISKSLVFSSLIMREGLLPQKRKSKPHLPRKGINAEGIYLLPCGSCAFVLFPLLSP